MTPLLLLPCGIAAAVIVYILAHEVADWVRYRPRKDGTE